MVSARLAVLFITGIISHDDGFKAALRVPSHTFNPRYSLSFLRAISVDSLFEILLNVVPSNLN